MCSYHGGKQRIGKQLAEVIVNESLKIGKDKGLTIKGYCEPFCGMLGVYQHIPDFYEKESSGGGEGLGKLKYKAGDNSKSVIMMWNAVKNGWEPPTDVTEEKYNKLKDGPDSPEKAFVGHQYSFGSMFFKGYAPKYDSTKNASSAIKRIKRISQKLSPSSGKNVVFKHGSYAQYSNLKGYIIYCDPPYGNREQWYTGCKGKSFDSVEFFKWCRIMSEHNIVFVTEYEAPSDFEKIWSKTIKVTGRGISQKYGKGSHTKREEKLYVVNSLF